MKLFILGVGINKIGNEQGLYNICFAKRTKTKMMSKFQTMSII